MQSQPTSSTTPRQLSMAACLAALALAGCGTTNAVSLNVPQPGPVNFQVVDQRPSDQRRSRTEEGRVGTTIFYGDDSLTPPPPELLKAYLAKDLSPQIEGKSIRLSSFVAQTWEPHAAVDTDRLSTAGASVPNANPLGMLLAAPLILGIESVKGRKTVTVAIHAYVDERPVSKVCSESFRGRVTEANVRSVVLGCVEQWSADARTPSGE